MRLDFMNFLISKLTHVRCSYSIIACIVFNKNENVHH